MSYWFARIAMCIVLSVCLGSMWAAGEEPLVPPVPAAGPGAPAPPADPGAVPLPPALPGVPPLPGDPGLTPPSTGVFDSTAGGFNTGAIGAADAVPTPPPLTALTSLPEAGDPTTTVVATAAPVEIYEFLFRDDENIGVVREKYTLREAEQLKEQEINRIYSENYTNPNQPAGLPAAPPGPVGGQTVPGGQPNPADPRAGAAWDFYYEQLTMYDEYVREKLVAGVPDLPELKYDAANALQEQSDLKAAFREAAVIIVNDQRNENEQFYERLQAREDRRRDFYEWLTRQQEDFAEWTSVWARKINGARWADGEPVRRDDWYYGVDFNSAEPVAIQIDQRDYLLSRTPQEDLAEGQLNVLSSNLTPYDIIDMTGTLKNPEMERLRGTLVQPSITIPAAEGGTVGTLQLVE